jgi:hypothetical protein
LPKNFNMHDETRRSDAATDTMTTGKQYSKVTDFPDDGRALPRFAVKIASIGTPECLTLALYLLTVFLNAALLFILEPMIARMVLPFAGGSPAVWNTSVLFFQTCLLLGYLYAHFATSWLSPTRHRAVHALVMLAGACFLPVAAPVSWFAAPLAHPVFTVLAALATSIGIPFFALSAQAPLLQKWFSQSSHPRAHDPYFIYAASNLGSMLGLLAYPFIIERFFSLRQQADLWRYGYFVLLCATVGCMLLTLRQNEEERVTDRRADEGKPSAIASEPITFARRLRWLAWSLVPSSLLLGVTTHITTDLVSAPLFWVVPLAIYLLTFALAFASERWATHEWLVRRQGFLLLAAVVTVLLQATTPVAILLPLHLLAFLATALVCHGQLAKDRPEPGRLTEFYLWISIGGVLGGVFNTIIAPAFFGSVLEYPLALTVAAFLRPYVGRAGQSRRARWLDGLLPTGLFFVMVFLGIFTRGARVPPLNARLLIFAIPGVLCLSFAYRPLRFGLGLSVLLCASLFAYNPIGLTLFQARSFFGVYRVVDDGVRHLLFHGTTAHGAQNSKSPLQPISYYHRTGPAGSVLRAAAVLRPQGSIAIVGLGSGALSCHGGPAQKFTYFEIDPLVEKIARDARLFSYLRDCPPRSEVVIGDARLTLSRAPEHYYDLLVLDAFSSDVIPTHLLTLEAVRIYLDKIAEDGILLIHISNRHMDLVPVFDRFAKEINLAAYLRNDFSVTPDEQNEGKSSSRWIVLGRKKQDLSSYIGPDWLPLDGRSAGELWTDDFTNILKILHWR